VSEENVEIVRRLHAALNRRDIETMVAAWDEEAEFRPIMAGLEGTVYRGREGLRQWLAALFEDWETFEGHPEEFHDGKVIRWQTFTDRVDALKAAGLRSSYRKARPSPR
jgi:hypothetical protein